MSNSKFINKDNNDILLIELLQKQRKDVPSDKKLFLPDIQRICKNISSSIFDEKECCIWNGYITNLNKNKKGTYINFYFKNKKMALHRILYVNYVDDLNSNYYIKYTCKNKGICCNINHLKRYQYKKKKSEEPPVETTPDESEEEEDDDDENENEEDEVKKKLLIKFD